jgi:hypothetical protein
LHGVEVVQGTGGQLCAAMDAWADTLAAPTERVMEWDAGARFALLTMMRGERDKLRQVSLKKRKDPAGAASSRR